MFWRFIQLFILYNIYGVSIGSLLKKIPYKETPQGVCTEGHVIIDLLQVSVDDATNIVSRIDQDYYTHYIKSCERGDNCGWLKEDIASTNVTLCRPETCYLKVFHRCIIFGSSITVDKCGSRVKLDDQLCPSGSILRLEDIEIGLPTCLIRCSEKQPDNSLHSLRDINADYFQDIQFKCNGRRNCDDLLLRPVQNHKETCSSGSRLSIFKRIHYQCLQATNHVLACNRDTIQDMKCGNDKVIRTQHVVYETRCTYNRNATCLMKPIYYQIDDQATTEVRSQCDGWNNCSPLLTTPDDSSALCSDNQVAVVRTRVYFSCDPTGNNNQGIAGTGGATRAGHETLEHPGLLVVILPSVLGAVVLIIIIVLSVKYSSRCPSVTCIRCGTVAVEWSLENPDDSDMPTMVGRRTLATYHNAVTEARSGTIRIQDKENTPKTPKNRHNKAMLPKPSECCNGDSCGEDNMTNERFEMCSMSTRCLNTSNSNDYVMNTEDSPPLKKPPPPPKSHKAFQAKDDDGYIISKNTVNDHSKSTDKPMGTPGKDAQGKRKKIKGYEDSKACMDSVGKPVASQGSIHDVLARQLAAECTNVTRDPGDGADQPVSPLEHAEQDLPDYDECRFGDELSNWNPNKLKDVLESEVRGDNSKDDGKKQGKRKNSTASTKSSDYAKKKIASKKATSDTTDHMDPTPIDNELNCYDECEFGNNKGSNPQLTQSQHHHDPVAGKGNQKDRTRAKRSPSLKKSKKVRQKKSIPEGILESDMPEELLKNSNTIKEPQQTPQIKKKGSEIQSTPVTKKKNEYLIVEPDEYIVEGCPGEDPEDHYADMDDPAHTKKERFEESLQGKLQLALQRRESHKNSPQLNRSISEDGGKQMSKKSVGKNPAARKSSSKRNYEKNKSDESTSSRTSKSGSKPSKSFQMSVGIIPEKTPQKPALAGSKPTISSVDIKHEPEETYGQHAHGRAGTTIAPDPDQIYDNWEAYA